MRELFDVLRATIDIALTRGTDVARSLALLRRPNFDATRGEVYLRALGRLAIACLVIPLPLICFGLLGGAFSKILGPITAILWSVVTIALALIASPLGIAVDALRGGVAGAGERYVRFVGNALFIEYSVAFLAAAIPLRNNPGGVPLLVVTLTLLVLAGALTKRWVVKMAVAALPLLLLSFFSPPIFRAVNGFVSSLEGRVTGAVEGVTQYVGSGSSVLPNEGGRQPGIYLRETRSFRVNRGEVVSTVVVGPGVTAETTSTRDAYFLSEYDPQTRAYRARYDVSTASSSWTGTVTGPMFFEGRSDGTVITIRVYETR